MTPIFFATSSGKIHVATDVWIRSVSPTQYAPGPPVMTGNFCVSLVIGCTFERRRTEEPRTTSEMISDAVGVGTKPWRLSFK